MRERFIRGKISDSEQLFGAVAKGAVGQVEKLLSRGVSPDCRDDKSGSPLIVAAGLGFTAVVAVLIRHNADSKAVDAIGYTPLMAAASNGHIEVVKLLVSNGADLEIRNKENLTASDVAKEMGFPEIVTYLSAQEASSSTVTETADDDGQTTNNAAGASLSFASVDDEPPTAGPAGATAGAAMIASPQSQSCVPELDLEQIPESGRTAYFEPYKETDAVGEDRPQRAEETPVDDNSDTVRPTSPGMEKAFATVTRAVEDTIGKTRVTRPAIPEDILEANEDRIVFDAYDNKLVRSANDKAKETIEKAILVLGDHTVDTVFKGRFMAFLKPRSQEWKRFRKLWKHPDLIIDPRRWTDGAGASAVRRYLLSEGIDVSFLTATHLIALYYVKDLKLILTLAEDAAAYKYTVRQLKRAIEELREHRDAQDPGKAIIKTLEQSLPLLEDPGLVELCTDKDRVIQDLSRAERKKIRSLIKDRKPGLDEWKGIMDNLEGILSGLDED